MEKNSHVVQVVPSKAALAHANKVYDAGQKIGYLIGIASSMGCEPELILSLQGYYDEKKVHLDFIQYEAGIKPCGHSRVRTK